MRSENFNSSDLEENQLIAQALTYKFAEHGINVSPADIIVGAAVTRYTFNVLSKNTRMCNFSRCEDGIMAVTQSNSVMIDAPIRGTSMIGVEIANKTRRNVDLLTLLRSPEFINAKGELIFTVGEDIMGKPFIADLAKLPNLLIAGATGSGKTTVLHSLIVSLICQYSPQYVRFVIAASNDIELAYCRTMPHLYSRSVIMSDGVLPCMDGLIAEMESRCNLFRGKNVGNISEYNKLADGKNLRRLPYLVFIVDEFSRLMSENKAEFERKMLMLTQKSAAAGIHIVLATQRPDEKVLTGSIKANMTSRIALKVCSAYDSQRIVGGGGAEKLIGRGDMLFVNTSDSEFTRIQGAHIDEDDILAVVRCSYR